MIIDYKEGWLVLKPENSIYTFDLGVVSTKVNCKITVERDPAKQIFKDISVRTVDVVKYLISD